MSDCIPLPSPDRAYGRQAFAPARKSRQLHNLVQLGYGDWVREPPRPSVREEWQTISAEAVEDLLLLGGYAFELREGARQWALQDLRRRIGSIAATRHDPGELVNSIIAQGLGGDHPFWLPRYVATGRRLAADLWQAADGAQADLSQLPARSFRVGFRRTFGLKHAAAGSKIRLRMPLPVQDSHLTDLKFSVEPVSADIRSDAGRLEARAVAGDGEFFTLAASFSFTAWPGLPHGRDEAGRDTSVWISEKEGPIQVTDRVRALADRLDRPAAPPFERVMAFRDHLIDTMACGMIHSECLSGPTALEWVLDTGWFDCRLGSALLVALCRAKGIPARLIGGYLLWDAPTEHYWMEAWLPGRGWTPFDLLAWDLSAGGQDKAWRNVLAGTIDYRMKTQIFPGLFTGAPGVPMKPPWHRLARAIPGGTETRFVSIPDGDLLYADEIRVFKA